MTKKLLNLAAILILLTVSINIKAQWDAPLVYYPFDATSGSDVTDASGNDFNGNANCDDCWEADGKFEGAFQFQSAQKIDLPAKDIALTNENGTVAFWVLLPESSVSDINCIWWAGEYGGDMFGPQNEMHINSEFFENNIWAGGEMVFVINDSIANENYFLFSDPWKGGDPATPPSDNVITIADGTWHHVACTWESGGNVALYMDGQAVWDTTAYNPNAWDCNLMTIGTANERTNRRLNGYLDEFRIYDESLSGNDIATLYNYEPDGTIDDMDKVNRNNLAALNVFPNPAGKQISIKNALGIEIVEIFNLTGEKQMIQDVSLTNEKTVINIEQLSSGFYFIRAYDKNGIIAVGKFNKD